MKRGEDSQRIQKLKQGARKRSIQEGIFASAKFSLANHFISPLAIAINSSSSLVALLSSVSGLLWPLSQTMGSRFIEKHPRKQIILKTVLFESLFLLPFIIISLLFYNGIVTDLLPLLLIISFAFYTIASGMGIPAWFSWMGDIVGEENRGRWFAKRNLLLGFVSVVVAISASIFLDYFTKKGMMMIGFAILFFLAFLCRITTLRIFKKKYEPKIKLQKDYYFSFTNFLFNAPKTNFGRFAIFRSLLAFSGSISGPLVAVYLLRNLQLNYTTYMAVIFSATIFSLIVMELWGKFADKYGNYKTIALTSILIPIIPILWTLNTSPIYFILVPALTMGVSWAGFNLAGSNFIYDNVSKERRGIAISYYNVLWGGGIALGAALGALLIKVVNTTFIEPIIIIFFIGSFARMIVVFWWVPKLKEVRKTKKFKGKKSIKNILLKEGKATVIEEAHEIMSLNKYLKS